jgi:hypothetical protein
VEDLAAHEGTSVGGLLQVLLAEHASSKCSARDGSALRQRMVPLFQDIVDAIGTAARVLAESPPAASASSVGPPAEKEEAEAPSFQEIQDWLRRVDANKSNPKSESKVAEFGRTLMRRAG